MNPLARILLYIASIVLIAAVLSPPIYWLCNTLAEAGIFPSLASFPFHRFFSRIVQIAALVLLWPVIRSLHIRGMAELGIEKNTHSRRDLLIGIGAALLPLIPLALAYFAFDIYKLRDELDWIKFTRILGAAAFVAVFEEFLFRGVLLGLAIRYFGIRAGVLLISAIFAIIHFVKPRAEIAPDAVHWLSGFQLLGSAFESADGPAIVISGCVTLFLIGLILAGATLRTRSLWLAIGLHAGWIFGQQSLNLIARFRIRPPDALLPWAGPNVVSGMVPTGLAPLVPLLATALLLWWYLRHAARSPGTLQSRSAR